MSDTPIRPLKRTPFTVVSLRIVRVDLSDCPRPFPLADGPNQFACVASHIDGAEEVFNAYWTCPVFERSGGIQFWSVFGRGRRPTVVISASANHERYNELTCWAFDPQVSPAGSSEVVHDGIGFDYSLIDDPKTEAAGTQIAE